MKEEGKFSYTTFDVNKLHIEILVKIKDYDYRKLNCWNSFYIYNVYWHFNINNPGKIKIKRTMKVHEGLEQNS